MVKDRKYNRKTVFVVCDNCGNVFEKVESEVKRNASKNRHNYCSRECSIKGAAKTRTGLKRGPVTGKALEHIHNICSNRRDKYTPFRYTYRTIKARYKEVSVTIDDLAEQWEKQKGICPYTGLHLILPENGNISTIDFFHRASLDRIDSTKGYVVGNIQFISTPINLMKQTQSDESVRNFLREISEYTSKL